MGNKDSKKRESGQQTISNKGNKVVTELPLLGAKDPGD